MLQDDGYNFFLEISSSTPPYLAFRHFFPLFPRFLLEITSLVKINCLNTLFFGNILIYAPRLWIYINMLPKKKEY